MDSHAAIRHTQSAIDQLRWWLTLPPTNLIERGDTIRFRHALYLMTHQVASALYERNGRPAQMHYPSRLADAVPILNALPIAPPDAGARLLAMIGTPDDRQAWTLAAALLADVVHTASSPPAAVPLLRTEAVDSSLIPHPSSLSLRTCAERTAARLARLGGVEAVALGGSLARGAADRRSDIDLGVFCGAMPDEQERAALLAGLPDVRTPLVEPACDTAWMGETLLHVRYWLSGSVDRMIAAFPAPPEDLLLAEELQLCLPLHDPLGRLNAWKGRMRTLPPALVGALIDRARQRLPVFRQRWTDAGGRGDLLHLYCLANQAVNDWLIALFARNGRFLSTPRWSYREMAGMAFLPHDAQARLLGIVGAMRDAGEAAGRWREMEALWAEGI